MRVRQPFPPAYSPLDVEIYERAERAKVKVAVDGLPGAEPLPRRTAAVDIARGGYVHHRAENAGAGEELLMLAFGSAKSLA